MHKVCKLLISFLPASVPSKIWSTCKLAVAPHTTHFPSRRITWLLSFSQLLVSLSLRLVEYCNLYGTGSMVNLEGVNCTARYNYCHENGHFLDDHHSGISTHGGGNNILIHHNTVDLSDAHFIAGGGGISGCITIYSDFVSARNVTISENLVAGGGYCMYGGNSGTFAPTSGGIMIQNNRISNLHWPNGGQFGWLASWDAAGIGNAISGNVWDADGAAIP